MSGIISVLEWIIANWSMLATLFSSIMSIALFFMHGAAKADIAELQQFINTLQISQTPIDMGSAKVEAEIMGHKV